MIGHGNRYAQALVALTLGLTCRCRRVKAVDSLDVLLPNQIATTLVATISSDGKARVYDLAQVPKPAPMQKVETIEPVGEYDSNGSRLVCLALVDSARMEEEGSAVVGKRKRNEDDGIEVIVGESGVQGVESPLGSGNG